MTPEQLIAAAGIVLATTAALAILVRILDLGLPDRFIRERHDLALASLILVPLVFALTFLPAPITERIVTMPSLVESAQPNLLAPAQTQETMIATTANIIRSQPEINLPWAIMALTLWGVGTLASLCILAIRLVRLRQLRRSARQITLPTGMHLSRPLNVFQHDDIGSPMLVGYFQPCIIVPTGFSFGSSARAVLEHEIAHAARGDSWITLGLHVLNAVFWWNLPQRIIAKIYYTARESLCDKRAAIITGAPESLAQALVDTAVEAYSHRSPVLAAAAHGMDLKARVRRLMSASGAVERSPVATMAFILPVMALSAVIATPSLGTAQTERATWTGRYSDNDDDNTPYSAAYRGDLEEVQARIAAGEDPSKALDGDGTPLMGAIRGGHDDIVDALLARGVDVNRVSDGDGSALIVAARVGRPDYVDKLLLAGADPNISVEGDGAPLISAAMRGNLEIIDSLLAADADPNIAVPRDGTPLIGAALHGNIDAAKSLIAAGADPNGYVYRDETPLINAAQQGELEMAKFLVTAGADVSLTVKTPHHDPGGGYRSPLSEAEHNGHDDVVRWLKEMGAEHKPAD
ncbi:MAG: ankyrin repeat domain-containing protein [Pseudomonadota bacterium]